MKFSGIFRWGSMVLATVAYVYFRFRGLADGCLWFDEIFSVHAATMGFPEMFEFIRLDLIHPPLFYILLKIWILAGGENFAWLRLFPLVFAVASIVPLWLSMRELKMEGGSMAGVILLVGVNGALIRYSQEVRMYAPLLFFSALSMWLFIRFFLLGKNIWLLGIANLLLVHIHYFGWIVVFSEIVVIASMQRIKIRPALIMLAGNIAGFLPWLAYVWTAPRGDGGVARNIGWMTRPDLGSILRLPLSLVEPFYYPFQNVDPFSVYAVSIPMLGFAACLFFLIAGRLRTMSNEARHAFCLPLLLVLVPLAAAFVASWVLPYSVWGIRHLIIIFFPFAVATGIAFGSIQKKFLGGAIATGFVVMIAAGFWTDRNRERHLILECAWPELASRLPDSDSGEIYVFEDVAAYDLWYALRSRQAKYTVVKLSHPEIPEDRAFFLPRGFDEVRVVSNFSGERFRVMFRDRWFDPTRAPIRELKDLGYKIGPPEVFDNPNGRVFLVEISR